MPLLYTYKCDQNKSLEENGKTIERKCDFKIKGYGGPYMYLKRDGKREILPHPIEDSVAKSLTGENLKDLFKKGLIIFQNTKICVNCSEFEKNCKCQEKEMIDIPKLEGKSCPKCKNGKIKKFSAGIS